jgi:DNA polymerase III subunit delta
MAATSLKGEAFLGYLKKGRVPAVSLWLGPEIYWRDQCRRAIVETKLPGDLRDQGYTRHDLAEVSLTEVLDDAQALSLFATERVIVAVGAEAAMPRVVREDSANEDLVNYCKNPVAGVTLVLDCSRYTFEGDDKARIDRLKMFYAAVPVMIEFAKPDLEQARELLDRLNDQYRLKFVPGSAELILEATSGDPARIANELEKLWLACGDGGEVTLELIADLLPNARASSIFKLVEAIGKGKTMLALDILDTLVRDGEYLPLALSFLGGQFRMALAAHQAGLRTSSQIEQHFRRLGIAIWRSKAEQVAQTVQAFSKQKLERALLETFRADFGLRDARPDDRVVLERYLLALRS